MLGELGPERPRLLDLAGEVPGHLAALALGAGRGLICGGEGGDRGVVIPRRLLVCLILINKLDPNVSKQLLGTLVF